MDIVLYVGNFGKTTSENELRNLFSQVGEVTSLRIVQDLKSGESQQYGFITMSAQSEADRAVNRFDNYLLGHDKLKVSITRPKAGRTTPGSRSVP